MNKHSTLRRDEKKMVNWLCKLYWERLASLWCYQFPKLRNLNKQHLIPRVLKLGLFPQKWFVLHYKRLRNLTDPFPNGLIPRGERWWDCGKARRVLVLNPAPSSLASSWHLQGSWGARAETGVANGFGPQGAIWEIGASRGRKLMEESPNLGMGGLLGVVTWRTFNTWAL